MSADSANKEMPVRRVLPYGRQSVSEADIAAVIEVLRSDWLTCGPVVTRFEERIRACLGVKHAIAVSNGTAALHLCALALGIRSGDVGLTSPLTFLASANCIAYCGGRPDFVDVDPSTYCLSVKALEDYLRHHPPPAVVIPVDFAGVPSDLPAIWGLAQQYGFRVVEDAAHSLGSQYEHAGTWFKCGSCAHADMAILSFHPVKTVTAGEGGMVLTNDDHLAYLARMYASHGMERDPRVFRPWSISSLTGRITAAHDSPPGQEKAPWLYQQQVLGYNYRITDIQCALGASQSGRLEEVVCRRQHIFAEYNRRFTGNPELILPPCPPRTKPAYHLYVLRFRERADRRRIEICAVLRERGIFAQVHYIPIYLQPWYRETYGYAVGKCPDCETIYDTCLSIPLYPSMTDDDIETVITSIDYITGWRRTTNGR
jgi:UDP-4-amino-4,6-dideoxy-N-acetyl-beta-L-altrosamine transaminase